MQQYLFYVVFVLLIALLIWGMGKSSISTLRRPYTPANPETEMAIRKRAKIIWFWVMVVLLIFGFLLHGYFSGASWLGGY